MPIAHDCLSPFVFAFKWYCIASGCWCHLVQAQCHSAGTNDVRRPSKIWLAYVVLSLLQMQKIHETNAASTWCNQNMEKQNHFKLLGWRPSQLGWRPYHFKLQGVKSMSRSAFLAPVWTWTLRGTKGKLGSLLNPIWSSPLPD